MTLKNKFGVDCDAFYGGRKNQRGAKRKDEVVALHAYGGLKLRSGEISKKTREIKRRERCVQKTASSSFLT